MSEKNFYCHSLALVESEEIGSGTRIWAFAHVMQGCTIGRDTNIGDHSFVESGVSIGSEVTVKNGVSIWAGVTLEDRVFVGPNAAFTNDLMPRSRVYHEETVKTQVCYGASIGANATIVAGITIGRFAMVGAGAVVTKSVRDYELVVGVPAEHQGWISEEGEKLVFTDGVAQDKYELIELGDRQQVRRIKSTING